MLQSKSIAFVVGTEQAISNAVASSTLGQGFCFAMWTCSEQKPIAPVVFLRPTCLILLSPPYFDLFAPGPEDRRGHGGRIAIPNDKEGGRSGWQQSFRFDAQGGRGSGVGVGTSKPSDPSMLGAATARGPGSGAGRTGGGPRGYKGEVSLM